MSRQESPPRYSAMFSIVASMTLAAMGSGLTFAYVPFTLNAHGFAPWIAGAAITAVATGGLAGCLVAGRLIRRVGHARAFMCFAALAIISAVIIAIGILPAAWVGSRALYGLAANGNFIVVQSWLNHVATNQWRGRAMSMFYMAYVIGLGTGSFMFGFVTGDSAMAPLLAVLCYTLAILPVGVTAIPLPPPPKNVTMNLGAVWRTSPLALVGVLAAGGLSMLVQGFTPIYASGQGLGQFQIATLMFLMQLGMLGVQYPLGALSDFIDRRLVLVITCLLVGASAIAAMLVPFSTFVLAIAVYAVWSGATETVYSISNAHANDVSAPDDYVSLASTMLFVWSVSATILPAIVTVITPIAGPKAYMVTVMLTAFAYAAYAMTQSRTPDSASKTAGRTSHL